MAQLTERQTKIIQESIKLIAEKGIQGLTIKNISKAIGISEPAIYRHFENKREIIKGIIGLLQEPAGKNQTTVSDTMDGMTQIRTMLINHTSRFIENPPITAIVFSEEMFHNESSVSGTIKNLMQRNQDRIIRLVEQGQADGSIRRDIKAEQLSQIIIGGFRFLVNKWHLNDYGFDLEKEIARLLDALEVMLRA